MSSKTVTFSYWMVLKVSRYPHGIINGTCLPRCTKNKPTTGKDQIVVKLQAEIPVSLFDKPEITFKMTIPEPENRIEIDADVQRQMADTLSELAGVTVTLEVSNDR